MAQVTVTINGKNYKVACDNGEEEHLKKLGIVLNDRVKEIANKVGQVDEARLLVMASLLLTDELSDVYSELEQIRTTGAQLVAGDTISVNIEEVAKKIENIAERIEQA